MENISELHKIRPAARLIHTIGSDLIKDLPAAVVELVKNGYDADAKNVDLVFTAIKKEQKIEKIKIFVKDNGHGMSYETIINKWMVPATKDKLDRKESPNGRKLQGRKGIGRFAAAALGNELLLVSVDVSHRKTELYIDWEQFSKKEYLDDVEILIENRTTQDQSGTMLEISAQFKKENEWTKNDTDILMQELRKLLSPLQNESDPFTIKLTFVEFPIINLNNEIELINDFIEIEPYPLIDFYDYRLSGKISDYGTGEFIFENKSLKGIADEKIIQEFKIKNLAFFGPIKIDLRVFDRDPESIDNLIQKGSKNSEAGLLMSRTDARKLLDVLTGISIYRGDFRIRPYGEIGFDWLSLDKRRVQNPAQRIGHNQVYGFITIQPEEKSHLIEKSARDGLKENSYYEAFKDVVSSTLGILEERRFYFRKKTGKGRRRINLEEELNKLFDFSSFNRRIEKKLKDTKVDKETIGEISEIIKKEETEKSGILDNIRETIAIYQGQATLGKIVTVILHEGRKPLAYFKNQGTIIQDWIEELKFKFNKEILNIIIDKLTSIKSQAEFFVELFNRLNPLAAKRRGPQKDFLLDKILERVFEVFVNELAINKIQHIINLDNNITIKGWEEDFYIIFTNLIENSIYWLKDSKLSERIIMVNVNDIDTKIIIDFIDNGLGIEKKLIEDELIFEPWFSTKKAGEGTGLGLAIAGEAISRNNGKLKAIYEDRGAHFQLEVNKN